MKKIIVILLCASAMLSACAAPEKDVPENSNIEQKDSEHQDNEEEVKQTEEVEEVIEEIRNLDATFYHQNRPQYYADDHLEVSFDEIKNAEGYEVEISKDANFNNSKIYELERNKLFVYSGKDDEFIPGCVNGYYVRARVKDSTWSEAVTIGCNALHFE